MAVSARGPYNSAVSMRLCSLSSSCWSMYLWYLVILVSRFSPAFKKAEMRPDLVASLQTGICVMCRSDASGLEHRTGSCTAGGTACSPSIFHDLAAHSILYLYGYGIVIVILRHQHPRL